MTSASKRKGAMHKVLAKHVNSACSARRQRLRNCVTARKDEYELEERCVSAVSDLCSDLRVSIDQVAMIVTFFFFLLNY